MIKEWNGIIDGCGSDLKDLTIFISFHLRWMLKSKFKDIEEKWPTVIEREPR